MSAFSLASYVIAGIWLTPYLVAHLGMAAYGMVPLAGVLTQFVALVSNSLSTAVTRFITIELHKEDGAPNAVFNTALAMLTGLAAFQAPFFALAVTNAATLFSIPAGLENDVFWLLAYSAAAFLLNFVASAFSVSAFTRNRLDLKGLIETSRVLTRVALIVLCFTLWGPRLYLIGAIDLGLAILSFGANVYLWKRLTPELRISIKDIRASQLTPILRMCGWLLVTQLGFLLFLRTDIWMINRFITPDAAGEYAAVLQWNYLFRQAVNAFFALSAPLVFMWYAQGDNAKLLAVVELSIKVASIALAVPVALLCFFRAPVLSMWLDRSISDEMAQALLITVLPLFVSLSFGTLFQLFQASDRMRPIGIVTLLFGMTNVALSLFWITQMNGGIVAVALVSAVLLVTKNVFVIPHLAHNVMRPTKGSYTLKLAPSVAVAALVVAIAYVCSSCLSDHTIAAIAVATILSTAAVVGVSWYWAISEHERELLRLVLMARLSRTGQGT